MPEPITNKPAQLGTAPVSKPKASFMAGWFLQYYKLATLAACLVIMLLGYFLLIAPKISTVQNIANTVLQKEEAKQAALKKRIEYLVNLEAARQQISNDDIARIGYMLPSEPGVPELLVSLESISVESFVKFENIQFSKLDADPGRPGSAPTKGSAVPGGAEAIEIQLTVGNTPYSNVKTLVSNIEKSLRLMDVAALLYSPAAKSYSLTVRSYYLP
ncbi:MAG: hypothetical protein AAB880_02325 [Patescibacteria group bacterium]